MRSELSEESLAGPGRSRAAGSLAPGLGIGRCPRFRGGEEVVRDGARWILAGALWAVSGQAMPEEGPEAEARKGRDGRLALSGKFGSIGPGVDLTYGWSRDLHARLSLNYDPEEEREERDRIRAAGSLLLDWHPGGGAFRVSGGFAVVHTEIGGSRSLERRSGSNDLTSYLGIGWGNPLRPGSRWTFLVDLGAFGGGGLSYTTAPDGSRATASGTRESDSGELRLRSSWRPVVSTGVSFRF